VRPGSWLGELFDAREGGEIDALEMAGAVMDYIAPSLDTTIMAIGHLLHRLGRDRAAWEMLRADSSLVPGAVAEVLRIDSPVKMLTRSTATATELGGVALPRHARVVVMYAAANRDPRRYPEPDRFDITRDARDHLAFGHGAHACVGAGLAQIEMEALLRALLERVAVLESGPPRVLRNNALYGFEQLPLRLVRASQ
jgi:cytochrome P450